MLCDVVCVYAVALYVVVMVYGIVCHCWCVNVMGVIAWLCMLLYGVGVCVCVAGMALHGVFGLCNWRLLDGVVLSGIVCM